MTLSGGCAYRTRSERHPRQDSSSGGAYPPSQRRTWAAPVDVLDWRQPRNCKEGAPMNADETMVGTATWVQETSGWLTPAARRAMLLPLVRGHLTNASGRLRLLLRLHPGRNAYVPPGRLAPPDSVLTQEAGSCGPHTAHPAAEPQLPHLPVRSRSRRDRGRRSRHRASLRGVHAARRRLGKPAGHGGLHPRLVEARTRDCGTSRAIHRRERSHADSHNPAP